MCSNGVADMFLLQEPMADLVAVNHDDVAPRRNFLRDGALAGTNASHNTDDGNEPGAGHRAGLLQENRGSPLFENGKVVRVCEPHEIMEVCLGCR